MIRVTLLAAMTMWGTSVMAQNGRVCATHEHNIDLQQSHPEMISRMQSIEKHTEEFIRHSAEYRTNEDVISIPVVVHVVWNTDKQNISDAQIQSQIDVLNEDFRQLNDNFSSTLDEFEDIAADLKIEFCLSSVAPNGKETNGITRTYSSRVHWGTGTDVKFSAEGGVDAWPTDQYLNMWVANIGGGILGYAQFPGGAKATDGVVMSPQYFGSREKEKEGENFNLRAPFDLGRTATHEVGHWLNLRHIWGDGGCGVDDLVEDTPMSDGANYGCPTSHMSCNSLDNMQNFMDYTDDVCMTMFTEGQKDRTRALFAQGGFRYSIRLSNGCGTIDTRCLAPENITVDNITDNSATLNFDEGVNGDSYTIQINENAHGWSTISTTNADPFLLQELVSCTTYEVRVISNCDDVSTQDTSKVVSFTTTGDQCGYQVCVTPTGLNVADHGGNFLIGNVLIEWDEVDNAQAYQYELRVASLPFLRIFKFVGSDITSMNYNGLPKWWSYEIRIRTKCDDELGYSEWTSYLRFKPGNNQSSNRTGQISESFEYDKSSVFSIYPNPAKQKLNLRFGAELKDVEISLIDMTGKVVKLQTGDLEPNEVTSIDLTGISEGMYFVNLRSQDTNLMTEKIMVTN